MIDAGLRAAGVRTGLFTSPHLIEPTERIQIDGMPVSGRADLLTEHRGGHNVIEDIRLRAGYQGDFEMPCARCLDPVAQRLEEHFALLFRPIGVDAAAPEHAIEPPHARRYDEI